MEGFPASAAPSPDRPRSRASGHRWREEDARATARVDAQDAYLVYEAVVDRPVEEVWRVQTDPREQPSWRVGLDRYDSDSPGGARGVGTQAHCVHGNTTIHQEIVDWKPWMGAITTWWVCQTAAI